LGSFLGSCLECCGLSDKICSCSLQVFLGCLADQQVLEAAAALAAEQSQQQEGAA
jgi:hypothetical protein